MADPAKPLAWSRAKPTEPGLYLTRLWSSWATSINLDRVTLEGDPPRIIVSGREHFPADLEWAGPIVIAEGGE